MNGTTGATAAGRPRRVLTKREYSRRRGVEFAELLKAIKRLRARGYYLAQKDRRRVVELLGEFLT
jgi:hypothetical protein